MSQCIEVQRGNIMGFLDKGKLKSTFCAFEAKKNTFKKWRSATKLKSCTLQLKKKIEVSRKNYTFIQLTSEEQLQKKTYIVTKNYISDKCGFKLSIHPLMTNALPFSLEYYAEQLFQTIIIQTIT